MSSAVLLSQPVVIDNDFDGANRCVHPVVRTHAETGKKSLYINPGFTSHLDGFTPAESKPILDPLYTHATKQDFLYRHTWRPHDVVVWDNRNLMHQACPWDMREKRVMFHTRIAGDPEHEGVEQAR